MTSEFNEDTNTRWHRLKLQWYEVEKKNEHYKCERDEGRNWKEQRLLNYNEIINAGEKFLVP